VNVPAVPPVNVVFAPLVIAAAWFTVSVKLCVASVPTPLCAVNVIGYVFPVPVAGVPLTVYGKGGQTRGYLNLKDTLQCVRLATETPAGSGELRVFNQFTEQFTVNELADRVKRVGTAMGLPVKIESIPNPRKEKEEHYYNAKHSGLLELGLQPHFMTDEVLAAMLETIIPYKPNIDAKKIMPRVRWS